MKQIFQTSELLRNSGYFYTIIIGMDNKYISVSPNYDHNFSFINDTLKGKPFYITLHPDDIKICQQVGAQCFENPQKLFPATLRKHNGKGGFVYTQWECKAIFKDDGSPEGIFCIGYNITDFIDTQNQLHDKEDKLYEIGMIQSHSVRKPLANIKGLLTMLDSFEVDPDVLYILNLMKKSALELDEIIQQINSKTN